MDDVSSSPKGLWLTQVWRDFWPGFDRVLEGRGKALGILLLGLGVGWWVYVPLHELLHALACVVFGGSVERLEIAEIFGGHLYAAIFPFVVAGGEYAGRLADFDTGGSDWVYLATDLGPYLLTLFPGVWAWRRAGRRGHAFAFGFWLTFAVAPFISVSGDAYEIGSLVVTQLEPWKDIEGLRGDDVFVVGEVLATHAFPPWMGFALATSLGVLWSFGTYFVAAKFADWLEARTSDASGSGRATAGRTS